MIKPLEALTKSDCQAVRYILTDVDDTLTWEGRLPTDSLVALEQLASRGLTVIPVTGGCAGWSDMMARTWPVAGVISEGGGVFIHKENPSSLTYQFWLDEALMTTQKTEMLAIVTSVLDRFPALRLARDQAYRLTDVAIDFAQDVRPPAIEAKEACLLALKELGLNAKASSIHINVSGEGYDKFAMAKRVLNHVYGLGDEGFAAQVMYVGDAPNDESMFARFPLSVGVANIAEHLPSMAYVPRFQTNFPGGFGFAELTQHLLSLR
ncbi:phosphoglycolate phosphatase [Marinomonas spartinae]|uniref:HAD-IIB family hydrolase n=1 Tax=Marinomonas spartinae TaxID=1792290 RepID=UPI000808E276|nr:HAD-IIB family hydrolase [Marinomonas spartinae]SBS40187.1 phosphoglycolate phosphatase [Marinomonas spartinae]